MEPLAQQLQERTRIAREKQAADTREAHNQARAKAGPHPIYEASALAGVISQIEGAIWKAAGEGKNELSIPFLSIPLLEERHRFMHIHFPSLPNLAKMELREAAEFVKEKFKETHPDFDAKSYKDDATIVLSISVFKITW